MRFSKLEAWLHTMEKCVSGPSVAATLPLAAPQQPGSQGSPVTACNKKRSPKQKPVAHIPPLQVSNRLCPLKDKPAEKTTLVIVILFTLAVTIPDCANRRSQI